MVDARAAAALPYRKRINKLTARIEELEQVLRDLTSPAECSLDHEGLCLAHDWSAESRCPHDHAKALLAAAPPPPSSEVDPLTGAPAVREVWQAMLERDGHG